MKQEVPSSRGTSHAWGLREGRPPTMHRMGCLNNRRFFFERKTSAQGCCATILDGMKRGRTSDRLRHAAVVQASIQPGTGCVISFDVPSHPGSTPTLPPLPPLPNAGACTLLAFLMSMAWMDVAANELVNLAQALGTIWDCRPALLSSTLLSWGNSLPDLISDYSLSRDGYPTMAVTACFASPIFTLLMGGSLLGFGGARTDGAGTC